MYGCKYTPNIKLNIPHIYMYTQTNKQNQTETSLTNCKLVLITVFPSREREMFFGRLNAF